VRSDPDALRLARVNGSLNHRQVETTVKGTVKQAVASAVESVVKELIEEVQSPQR
jgi:hypothetical protein